MIPFAIQLYSVRDHLAVDPLRTLQRLKAMGYDNVELFQVGVAEAREYQALLAEAELAAIGAHIDYDEVIADVAGVIAAAQILDIEHVVIPWLNFPTEQEWHEAAHSMDAAGKRFREAGLRLGYHNHDHEWKRFGNRSALDIIFDTAAGENLFLELDVFWAQEAGNDPVEIIGKFRNRCPLLHIKEKAVSGDCRFTELGSGKTGWRSIFRAGAQAGVQWYIVEQDESAGDTLDSAAESARFMAAS